MKLHEYQNKGVTKKAFRKSLILKDGAWRCLGVAEAKMAAAKRKAGASSRTPNVVIYSIKYTRKYEEVKRNLRNLRNSGQRSRKRARGQSFSCGMSNLNGASRIATVEAGAYIDGRPGRRVEDFQRIWEESWRN
jgi:hypothetical protein